MHIVVNEQRSCALFHGLKNVLGALAKICETGFNEGSCRPKENEAGNHSIHYHIQPRGPSSMRRVTR